MRQLLAPRSWAAVTLALAACAASASPPCAEVVRIPLDREATGGPTLEARICRPLAAQAPPRVVVINHGAPPSQIDPGLIGPLSCESEQARWFLARNFVVVAGMRRGFGRSDGRIAESGGPCDDPDFVTAGRRSAEDVAAIVRYALALPGVRSDNALVVGESTGGWATVAYAGVADPAVTMLVDLGGGRTGPPGVPCGTERLVRAAGTFGRQAATPMLWIYSQNDSYFPPRVANAMHEQFVAAGGHADLALTAPFGREGHGLFHQDGGSQIWGPILDGYLGERPSRAMSASR